jgi:hypothetical protein
VASAAPVSEPPKSMKDARVTILRAVADGQMDPEEAERLLFPEA